MGEELVTVAAYPDLTTAQFFQSLLEENGIDTFIPSENAIGTRYPAVWLTTPGVSLQVSSGDAERACELLEEMAERHAENDPDADLDDQLEEDPVELSGDRLNGLRLYAAVVALVLGAVVFCLLIDWLIELVTR